MAKSYISAVKYMIRIDFTIGGIVDRPDIIGAIFGQSEGLLGEDMDLKELQKNGKVGRIEINAKSALGKTRGELLVPSSMDTVQTSILAAAIESVDKVGPCDAKFNVTNIEDVRKGKRDGIKQRAKDLLQKMMTEQIPESDELAREVKEGRRKAEVVEYGRERVPAGPDIDKSDEIIVVEGRADVLNLLKNGIKNAVGMGGTQISQTVVDLSRRKSITVFVDGDRGGELNARKLQQIAKVDFVAKAPDGKEVEELTGKEILLSLKKRQPAGEGEFKRGYRRKEPLPISGGHETADYAQRRSGYAEGRAPYRGREKTGYMGGGGRAPYPSGRPYLRRRMPMPIAETPRQEEVRLSAEEETLFMPAMKELAGTLKARLFDEGMKQLDACEVKDLVERLHGSKKVHAIVFDGIITSRLVEEAAGHDVKYIVGAKRGKIAETKGIKAAALNLQGLPPAQEVAPKNAE